MGDARSTVDLLVDTERVSKAALLARAYVPSRVGKAVSAWRGELEKKWRAKVGALIGDPLRGEEKAGRTNCTSSGRRTGCTLTLG